MKEYAKWLFVVVHRFAVAALVAVVGRVVSFVASVIGCRCPTWMLCKKPYVKGITPFPCGQCLPCRLNRRRLWCHRLMLEAQCHEFSSFWTLTYSPEMEPADGSVDPVSLSAWLKRLRRRLGPGRPIRFYAVGEYGEETFRPHYHAALFGVSRLEDALIADTWGMGNVFGGDLTLQSAQYICGYVTKKMTKHEDPRLQGRYPEFARMSLRPGIGALFVPAIADSLGDVHGARFISSTGDVPTSLNHGRKSLPLGRYLRRKLREACGFETVGGQAKPEAVRQAEMQALLEASGSRSAYLIEKPFVEHQKIVQVEGKAKIWRKKGSL